MTNSFWQLYSNAIFHSAIWSFAPAQDRWTGPRDGQWPSPPRSCKFNVYKVNADEEVDVAQAFGVQSIPSLLLIPLGEKPQKLVGAMPKRALMKAVKDVLKVE
jgi:hypothetical protein